MFKIPGRINICCKDMNDLYIILNIYEDQGHALSLTKINKC